MQFAYPFGSRLLEFGILTISGEFNREPLISIGLENPVSRAAFGKPLAPILQVFVNSLISLGG